MILSRGSAVVAGPLLCVVVAIILLTMVMPEEKRLIAVHDAKARQMQNSADDDAGELQKS